MQLVTVMDVQSVDKPTGVENRGPDDTFYEVTVKPTSVMRRFWPHTFSLFFGALPFGQGGFPLGGQLYLIEDLLVGSIGASIALLVSIIITAFFIPNMLRKGTVDMLVVKPIRRPTLLIYKFLGGLTFILLNTALVVVGVWAALGIRSGVWAPGFLLMIPVLTFSFAILYSVSTLFAVLTRSAVVAILMTCLVWFVLFITTTIHGIFEERRRVEEKNETPVEARWGNNLFGRIVDVVYSVLPRRGDMDSLTTQLLVRDLLTDNQIEAQKLNPRKISWLESLAVSGVFIAVMLGFSCWRFASKDY
jgi:ABC-type transport system involved in multi-copper enzyme maturation permease subunit